MLPITKRWTRRHFLRAAGIASAATAVSPWIPSESHAATSGLKRLILVQTGNGSILPNWRNNGSGAAFKDDAMLPELRGPILGPLDAHRDSLLLLDGIDLSTIYPSNTKNGRTGNTGHAGSSVLWTGRNGGGQKFEGDAGSYPNGPSLDQIVNERIGEGRRSLQLGIWNRPIDPRQVYSYDLNGTPLPVEPNPQVVFDSIFSDGFPDAGTPDRKGPRRKRSIALLRGELTRLRAQLSGADRQRFERHVEGLDSMETRIDALANGPACGVSVADRPSVGKDFRDDPDATVDAQIANIIHALSCDMSRVVSFSLTPENVWGSSASFSKVMAWKGGGVHTQSHNTNQGTSAGERQQAIADITTLNNWSAKKFAALLAALKAANLMEDTLVVWGMAMSHAGYHSNRNIPIVVAQGSSGPLKTGRYMRWGHYEQEPEGGCDGCGGGNAEGNETNNNLLISLAHAMGLSDVTEFGDPSRCRATGLNSRLMK
jgi:hypothetical protein